MRAIFFNLTSSCEVSTVWYDASFLKRNGKIIMKWLSQPVSSRVHEQNRSEAENHSEVTCASVFV